MARELWGVDSASKVTDELYKCVVDNYGKPAYWGRYLKTIPDVSRGLTTQEIRFVRDKGIKILPIYNDFQAAVGYDKGKIAARNSISNARRLGISKDIFIFANIERFFDVNEGWIRGWVDVMYTSGFRPGIYADTDSREFNEAYCTAASKSEKVSNQTVIWTREPEKGVTTKRKAPKFQPVVPPCIANVWAWQYGRNAPECSIDTNLIDRKLYNNLW
jgi:hypothetical protein